MSGARTSPITPRAINAFLQRVGRAGHAIGAIPKGRLLPLTQDDLLKCTALLAAVAAGANIWNDVAALRFSPDAPAVAAELGCDGGCRLSIEIGHDHVCAARSELVGAREADSARSPGHEGAVPGQVLLSHGNLPKCDAGRARCGRYARPRRR